MAEVPAKWRALHGIKAEKKTIKEDVAPATVRVVSPVNNGASNRASAVDVGVGVENGPNTVPEGKVFEQKIELVRKLLNNIFPGLPNVRKTALGIAKLIPRRKNVEEMKADFANENFKVAMRYFAGMEVNGLEKLKPNLAMKAQSLEVFELIKFYFNVLNEQIGVNGATIRSLLTEIRGLDMAIGLVPSQWMERISSKANESAKDASRDGAN
jgi:hypothetical protein